MKEVWLNFEKNIRTASRTRSLVSYAEIVDIAESSFIFDKQEILEAVRFLNDLGALQYFENSSLRDRVVINPQV